MQDAEFLLKRRRRRLLLLGLGLSLAFVGTTVLALESHEVARLRTRTPDGTLHTTRVWLAHDGAALWLEAATPERGWYQQILEDPAVELEIDGEVRRYRAVPVPEPGGHDRIRAMLREKYGWADVWVGLLQDTSQSLAVRLEPPDA